MSRRIHTYIHSFRFTILTACLSPFVAFGQTASDMVYENATEFQTLADVNGDGVHDLIVADKASGSFRIAEGQSDGSVVWRENVGHSGLAPMTGFSTGPVLDPHHAQLVFSATLGNRIQIIDTPSDSRLNEPLRVPNTLIGPTLVTAINIPGGISEADYDEDFFDLVYHATLDHADKTDILEFYRNDGSGLPFVDKAVVSGSDSNPSRPNRIKLSGGGLSAYGVLITDNDSSDNSFLLLSPDDGLEQELGVVSGLPDNAAYVYADFDGDGAAEFIFYQAGSEVLYESEWNSSGLSALSTAKYATEIAEIHVVHSTGTPELLIIHAGRAQADRVSYTGLGGGFPIQENFSASEGVFRGALSLDDSLHFLEGDARTRTSHQFDFDGSQHNFVATQDLPTLPDAGAAGASVLLFDAEPLLDPDARLLSRYHAGPWTSSFKLSGGNARLISERFQGGSDGLGDAQWQIIQSAPANTGGGLTNQIADDNSIFFQDAASGEITSVLSVTPPAGTYDRALRPSFEIQGDATTIEYRTSTRMTEWTSITETPPLILDDTTLYAVASNAAGAFSNIVQVDYVITGSPDTRDSNGDGVPDFVALQYGLDPLASNNDADGDGFTNLQEILAGTDPTSASSKPNDRDDIDFEYPNSFDLQVAPAVPNPGSGTELLRPYAAGGSVPAARLVVHQPDGVFLGAEHTQDLSGLSNPAAPFQALDMVAKDLFVVSASSSTFKVQDGSAKDYGRAVAGLIKTPALNFEGFDYSDFGNHGGFNNLPAESAAWRSAAIVYFNDLARPNVLRDPVDAEATLELLLVETIIGQQLAARELSDRPNVTLTPFRQIENPLEALAPGSVIPDPIPSLKRDRTVSIAQLQALQRREGTSAAFSIQGIIDTVRDQLATASSNDVQQLKTIAERLYTSSATAGEAGSLRQPLDALRHFIRQGDLTNTGYEKTPVVANFPSTLLSEAAQGVATIVGSISPRTVETVTLYFAGDENASNCPVWEEVFYSHGNFDPEAPNYTGTHYTLLDDQGDHFPVARAFPLTSGSVFQVSGYVLDQAPCGDRALEVIPQPTLTFLRNQSPSDTNGNLIPDNLEELNPDANLDAFADSDGDGYTDLQEILEGSDPLDSFSRPAGTVRDVNPPQLKIRSISSTQSIIEFDFAADYAEHISFQLYSTEDLGSGFNATTQSARHLGSGQHELTVDQIEDQHFYILRMQLK